MRLSILGIPALLLLSSVTNADETTIYKLHHRFLPHPSPQSPLAYQPLGNVKIHDNSYNFIVTSENTNDGIEQTDNGKGWYQVGVQLGENDLSEEWLITSTRSCYLYSTLPKIEIHLSSSSIPTSISILPLSNKGCHSNLTQSIKLPTSNQLLVEFSKSSHRTTSPNLAPPPTVDPSTGSPAPPEEEKSFMQKYWMYIVGIALFFAIQMGPDDPKGGSATAK
ncbi:uncharacterized protein I206_104419 [Kwoniella pini CBS 10737]|uniref:ER membrane protein complex subunit 10 n=1 Tax=Kwoniella pini CBS 10737 TaxID=1296096 RepID=A0A1B9I1R7_9TREE|nr:uncharacterized protein I206_04000 [Kwoniella pini CBS 10737]OCF49479.1 hypothetical protein I206_04000 [Kwoniella pini CBS 10737]